MNDAITSEMMFGIPTDFPRIVDSVADSLCSGFKDYCFSTKQLKDIITICKNPWSWKFNLKTFHNNNFLCICQIRILKN